MIFLKKIEIQGFKTFANNTVIDLSKPAIGIIGPNGSGKSNIIDAIVWTIGNFSNKTIRAKKDDLSYYGGKHSQAAKKIRVSLTFNNINNILKTGEDVVVVTKEYDVKTQTNSYFINEKPALLKDVNSMFLDTGLSKNSLGVIRQNAISWFSEAKGVERRVVFEEAAGIGLYKSQKQESINLLKKAQESLDHWTNIIQTDEKYIKKLSKQVEDLNNYLAIKKELTHLDLTMIVRSYLHKTKIIEDNNNQLTQINSQIKKIEPFSENERQEVLRLKDIWDKNEEELKKISADFDFYDNEVRRLTAVVEQEKKDLSSQYINSLNPEERKKSLLNIIQDLKSEYEACQRIISQKKDSIHNNGISLTNNKVNETKIVNDLQDLQIKRSNLIFDFQRLQKEYDQQFSSQRGVRTILESKDSVPGVCGVVSEFISTKQEHELAVSTAFAKSINNIIVINNQAAKNCIDFLKVNKAGTATFLPLENIEPRSVLDLHLSAAKLTKGFVDVASNLVKIDNKYRVAIDNLLGNILVAEDIDSAFAISGYTYKKYKVVTLDGQIVHTGGAVSGGDVKPSTTLLNVEQKLESYKKEIEILENEINLKTSQKNKLSSQIIDLESNNDIYERTIKQLDDRISNLKIELEKYTVQYNNIVGGNLSQEQIEAKMSQKNQELFDATNNFNNAKIRFDALRELITKNKNDYETKHNLYIKNNQELSTLKINKSKLESNNDIENTLVLSLKQKIIDEYSLTIENAISQYKDVVLEHTEFNANKRIQELKVEIKKYSSNVNLNAVAEYDDKLKEHEQNKIEYTKAQTAVNDIIQSIDQIDKKAKEDFMKTLKAANNEIPKIFEYMFGGGSCIIKLEDEKELLESGIDIIVNFPNKAGANLNLLSGGEKAMVALVILFTLLKIAKFPLVILDEAEAPLDAVNVDKFGKIISKYSIETQFLVITHREGTMKNCHKLIGVSVNADKVSSILDIDLKDEKWKFNQGE